MKIYFAEHLWQCGLKNFYIEQFLDFSCNILFRLDFQKQSTEVVL